MWIKDKVMERRARRKWAIATIEECERIMNSATPGSESFKDAFNTRKELMSELYGGNPEVRKTIITTSGSLVSYVGALCLESFGFMIPTRWFQADPTKRR